MTKHIHLLPEPKKGVLFFPQIHRFIPARIFTTTFTAAQKILLWIVLISVIAVNVSILQPSDRKSVSRLLSTVAYSINSYRLDRSKSDKTAVLGAESKRNASDLQRQKLEATLAAYAYWQSVILRHPDYRDAQYMLATLAYQLGKYDEATAYLNTTTQLDPNYRGIATLRALLQKVTQ